MKRGMTHKHRLLALALCLSMVLGLSVTGASAAKRFVDLPVSHWAYDEVMDVVDKDLFLGTGKDTFSPEVEMTRAMFVTVLARLANADVDDDQKSGFDDVPRDTWYTGSVVWAAEKGIVKGVGDDSFAPNRVITREEMATMIVRYADYWGIELPKTEKKNQFDDWQKISDYADDAVEACQRAGLLKGVGDNKFDPKGTATRCQVAALISRFSELDDTAIYTVRFDSNGGTKVPDQEVLSGEKAKKPTGVRRSNYTLVNWYTDDDFKHVYNFRDPVTEDLTLYAKWRRNTYSGGGSSVSYPQPALPDSVDVEAALDGTALQGISLTYPTVTMSGNKIVLTGAYRTGTSFPGFDAAKYNAGYVVPLMLSAPSNYTEGKPVKLTTENDLTNKTEDVTLDGPGFFYLLKYIPEAAENWNPTVTVDWDGTKVAYTFDVSGMKKSLDSAPAGRVEVDDPTLPHDIALTFPEVAVTGGTDGKYGLHLSGGFVAGTNFPGFDPAKYSDGYVVPLRFTAPDGFDKDNAKISLHVTGGLEEISRDAAWDGQDFFNFLLFVPSSPSSSWKPVVEVTWTKTETNTLAALLDNVTAVEQSFTLNVAGMKAVRTAKTPWAPTAAEMQKATEITSNQPFRGIENFTAQAAFQAPVTAEGVTAINVDVKYQPFLTGTVVPGFGTAGTDLPKGTFLLPIAFDTPAYLNLDALDSEDQAMAYTIYHAGDPQAASVTKTKADVEGEPHFMLWLQVSPERAEILRTRGIRVDFAWFGGYTERYLFKLTSAESTTALLESQAPVSGNDTMSEANKDPADPFHGLDQVAAQVAVTKTDGVYVVNGSYERWVPDQTVPGFGKAGTEDVPLGGCVVPLAFRTPTGLDMGRLGSGDKAVTWAVSKKAAGETEFTPYKSYDFTKAMLQAENPMHYYAMVKDPAAAKGGELQFKMTWWNGFEETFAIRFGDLKAKDSNEAGEKYNLTEADKKAISQEEGPLQGIQINTVKLALVAGNVLRLTAVDGPQEAAAIRPYYGETYGKGYIVALKFHAPDTADSVVQTILNGYTGSSQEKTVALDKDRDHIMLFYIPETMPAGYAPEIKLDWKSGDSEVRTERWKLDLVGMNLKSPAPVPEPVPEPAPELSDPSKPQTEPTEP